MQATLVFSAYYTDGSGVTVMVQKPDGLRLVANLQPDGTVHVPMPQGYRGTRLALKPRDEALVTRVLWDFVQTLPDTMRATLARVAAMEPAARAAYFAPFESGERPAEAVERFDRRPIGPTPPRGGRRAR